MKTFDVKAWRIKTKEQRLAYNRKWNHEHPEANRLYRIKRKEKMALYSKRYREIKADVKRSHNIVNNLIRAGKLTRLPCTVCGSVRSQGHHPDYSKPTEVIWLCATHHRQIHLQAIAA